MKKNLVVFSGKTAKEYVFNYDKSIMFDVLKSELRDNEYILDGILAELVDALIESCPIDVRKEVGNE
jgi:hypothetical protein